MKNTYFIMTAFAWGVGLSFANEALFADEACHDHSSDHKHGALAAPISVMGSHTHEEAGAMFSYRFGFMNMQGMQEGSSNVSSTDVFAGNYTVTPEEMDMQMHMFGWMYAPSGRCTLMAMASWQRTEMSHRIFASAAPLLALNEGADTFTTKTQGWGDVKLSALYSLWQADHVRVHASMGLSLPTGSIGEQGVVPGPGGRLLRQLPASMQLGSGTFDLLPALTALVEKDAYAYGGQLSGVLRLGRNHHGYTLGDQFKANAWWSYLLHPRLSSSLQLRYQWSDALRGTQSDLSFNPPFAPSRLTVPTAFAENYGRQQLDVGVGLNLLSPGSAERDDRLAVELLLPLWQDVNGLQLENDLQLVLAWQMTW